MKPSAKKALKITVISLVALIILCLTGIGIIVNFVFTPEKLTPVVLNIANEKLNAHLDIKRVELTFFSTFPQFGLRIENGALISRALNDSCPAREDSLLSFRECLITVNPLAYLTENRISLQNFVLQDASVYAFRDKDGRANWDIVRPDTTATAPQDSTSGTFDSEIDIRKVKLLHTNLVFDDRDTRIYTRLQDANLQLSASLTKGNSKLKLEFDNKNLLFWQQGELLANHITSSVKTDIAIDRKTRVWTLNESEVTVNGIKFDAHGTLHRDTLAKAVDINIDYGLHAPSMETVLSLIPESILKKAEVTAKGEVIVKGNVKGQYGKEKLPAITLCIQVNKASARYDGLPYGIDEVTADFDAYVDLMRQNPSYADLKIFHFKGAHTDILASAKVEDLLTDPLISFETKSTVDLNKLAQTFPLQEGVTIGGKLNADLTFRGRLSTIKKQDIGRVKAKGKIKLDGFELKDIHKKFFFSSNASLDFSGNNTLHAKAEIHKMVLESKRLSSSIERLDADITTTNPQDTTHIVTLNCLLTLNKLKANMHDSIVLYSGRTAGKISIKPGIKNPQKPYVELGLRTDSLFARYLKNKLGMDAAGFNLKGEKVKDSLWTVDGVVGFNRLFCSTPAFGLPIRMKKTKITLSSDRCITLDNAALRIGRSSLVASGSIRNLMGAIRKNEMLTARLNIIGDNIDCNQLINALPSEEDSLASNIPDNIDDAETIQLSQGESAMKLFIIPKNIDFELTTDIKKVTFDKMVFENIHGAIDIKDQYLYMKDLSMRALDANMKTILVYRASERKRGYTGFDFKIENINVAKLVDFIPSLDTIVPMLKAFKGHVNFNVTAEARLDSLMNIQIPSLHSAVHIKGDSLVLLDGETFSSISKLLMFKNKKQNVFDSISVNITVQDGKVTVYPFLVEIDRYKAAIGGTQGLDMNFDYHISILKSPLPFKAGLNISGNPDKLKFRVGKAKYKDAVTPVSIHKVDSTRMNLSRDITEKFEKMLHRRSQSGRRTRTE